MSESENVRRKSQAVTVEGADRLENRSESTALSEAYGISCRACGAPRDLSADPCPSCEAPAPDVAERPALLLHRDRLRRLHQRIRCLAAIRAMHARPDSGLLQSRAIRRACGGLFVVLVPLTAFWLMEGLVSCGMVLLLVTVVGVVLWAAIRVSMAFLSRAAERARREVAEQLSRLDATTPVSCPSCGGRAAVLSVAAGTGLPCPWCGARILAPVESGDSQSERALELLRAEQARGREAIGTAQRVLPELPEREVPAGFDWSTGLLAGSYRGLSMWYAEDALPGETLGRLEVSAETGCGLRLFVAQAESETVFREMAAEWHYPLPATYRATWLDRWLLYYDEGEPHTYRNVLVPPLYDLETSDCLVLDRGGVSLWRRGIVEGCDPDLLLEQRDTIVTLIADLGIVTARR